MVKLRRPLIQVTDTSAPRIRPRTTSGAPVRRLWLCLVATTALAAAGGVAAAQGQNARFDLVGPNVEVRVTRAGVTLPISSVPNLQPGDRLWLHPDLPPSQSVHYLMVLAFLRGTTNPPPLRWFFRIQTWDKKVRAEGVEVTVPDEAQQAVLFLAPVTGGDFSTLRSAVQGRPGIFVRASQDLAAAGFEQARVEKYLASMHELSPAEDADPKQLQEHSNLIAATLALKPNGDCIKLPADQQYTCLTQTGGQSLLDDGHGQTIVDALTGGTSANLIGTASYTALAGGGVYSAYVGSIVDLVHIMGSLHTAQYQYIPAIAFPQQQALNLRLNTPPSFHNPKSVIVIGLPAIQKTTPPPLRAAEPNQVSCLQQPGVVLPVEGAPLVFSTGFAHHLVLHLNDPAGDKPGSSEPRDIPLSADAYRGGLVLATIPKRHNLPFLPTASPPQSTTAKVAAQASPTPHVLASAPDTSSGTELTGTIKGFWGFDAFTGPTMPLEETPGRDWKLAGDEPIIAGKNQQVVLSSTGTACIQSITLERAVGQPEKETWKAADKPNHVAVMLDVPARESNALHLDILQFGDPKPQTVSLVSYIPPARLDTLSFHTGDTSAILTGTSLDQVREVEFGGLTFKPDAINATSGVQTGRNTELRVIVSEGSKSAALNVGDHFTAQIALNDGRTLRLPLLVEAARPTVSLLSKADVLPEAQPKTPFNIKLASQDDLPVGDALIFSLKSAKPFPRAGKIEIASPDDSLHAMLSLSDPGASLILESPDTLLATLQPLKVFGASAFGPIRMRAIAPDGTAGDWLPLVTLVRLPTFTRLSCPVAAAPPPAVASPSASPASVVPTVIPPPPSLCTLSGTGLYFLDSIATDESFASSTRVPQGFVGLSLQVPPPTGSAYYLRLRDDPTAINTVTLPAGPL